MAKFNVKVTGCRPTSAAVEGQSAPLNLVTVRAASAVDNRDRNRRDGSKRFYQVVTDKTYSVGEKLRLRVALGTFTLEAR